MYASMGIEQSTGDAGGGEVVYQDVGALRGSEFHSRLSLAIRLDASSPVLLPLAKNEGAIFPVYALGEPTN